ncbi:ABC transporter ATP-binding protein [Hydrogenophaga soli]
MTQTRRTTADATPTWAVEMLGVHKRFGAVRANHGVDLRVRPGHIHALVGENGAGKSTLMSILYGFYEADSGTLRVAGREVRIRNAQDAIALGVGMVHQHFMLVETLSALDNVMLGAESSRWLSKAAPVARERLNGLMRDTGLHVDLDTPVGDLPVGDRQRVEILKALFRGANILILDEPTAVLTPQEIGQLFEVLRRLREQGTTVIIITHKLKEVVGLCDHVTVMRAGTVVHETPVADTSVQALAEAMVGRKVHLMAPNTATQTDTATPPEVRLDAHDLRVVDAWGVERLKGVSLQLRAGEIVGVAGVSGNGQSELLEVLSGLLAPRTGRLVVNGNTFEPAAWLHPTQARQLGLAHVPEDRHARAMVMGFAAWESAVLGYEQWPDYSTAWGWMHPHTMQAHTADMMERFDVRPRDPWLTSAKFSGGNQQKLVLARELGRAPSVLLIGQPTRGVDIGAIEFIHGQLRRLREAGCAVLLVSSELDEILALSDRVVVMCQGAVTGELPVAECTETRLGLMMAGGSAA